MSGDTDRWNAFEYGNCISRQLACILTCLIFDETGDRLSPTHATKNGVRYRYYISNRLMNGGPNQSDGWRLPANELEQPILNILQEHLSDQLKLIELIDLEAGSIHQHQTLFASADRLARKLEKSSPSEQKQILASFIHRIELQPTKLLLEIDSATLREVLEESNSKNQTTQKSSNTIKRIELNYNFRKRGVEAKLVLGDANIRKPNPDDHLIKLVAKAHLWLSKLTDGTTISINKLATQQGEDPNEISRFLPLAFLAPDIIESILTGTQPVDLTSEKLRRIPTLPNAWNEQRELLGFAA